MNIGDGIAWPDAKCCSSGIWDDECVCPRMERALRGWSAGAEMPAMTPEQRDHCLSEICRVEGYNRSEHERDSDSDLSRTVLSAWTDCCRDKGLL